MTDIIPLFDVFLDTEIPMDQPAYFAGPVGEKLGREKLAEYFVFNVPADIEWITIQGGGRLVNLGPIGSNFAARMYLDGDDYLYNQPKGYDGIFWNGIPLGNGGAFRETQYAGSGSEFSTKAPRRLTVGVGAGFDIEPGQHILRVHGNHTENAPLGGGRLHAWRSYSVTGYKNP